MASNGLNINIKFVLKREMARTSCEIKRPFILTFANSLVCADHAQQITKIRPTDGYMLIKKVFLLE